MGGITAKVYRREVSRKSYHGEIAFGLINIF